MASCSTMEEAKLPGGYLVTPRVPQGLAAAVEGLTREVIRHSPKDIYAFAAHHFEKLLRVRERCEVTSFEKSCTGNRRGDEETRALREMSRILRARELDRATSGRTGKPPDRIGWSLSQTAKVLKRHRSIFGEASRSEAIDQVFLSPERREETSEDRAEVRAKRSSRERGASSRRDELWKTTTRRHERASKGESTEERGDSRDERGGRSGPRIMTPIANLSCVNVMLAKDIKTELRKNRMSSREGRSARASRREEKSHRAERGERGRDVASQSRASSFAKKSCPDGQRRVEASIRESGRSRTNDDPTSRRQRGKIRDASLGNEKNPKTPAGDELEERVVGTFAATKSLEELRTLNYVERVQEIIDETRPIIKEKIERLRTVATRGPEDASWLGKTRESRDERGDSRDARQWESRLASPRLSSTGDALASRLTETRDLMESVSSSFARPARRSRSARSFRRSDDTREAIALPEERREEAFDVRENLLEARSSRAREPLENVSHGPSRPVRRSSSAKSSLREHRETTDDANGSKDALRKRLDETRNLLRGISASLGKAGKKMRGPFDAEESSDSEDRARTSLPAVRSSTVRGSPGSASRSDPNDLVLPAISPEVPKSAKIREDLILPVLSPSATASIVEADSGKILDANEDATLGNFAVSRIPDEDRAAEGAIGNVSRDSLNASPSSYDTPQRPDSLEPVETIDVPEEVTRVEASVQGTDRLPAATSAFDDLEGRTSGVKVLELELSEVAEPAEDASNARDNEAEASTPDDLESRLREIRRVESNVAEALGMKINADFRASASSLVADDLREFEGDEKLVDAISETENREGETKGRAEVDDAASDHGKAIEKEASEFGEANETRGNGESPHEDRTCDESREPSPDPLNYTYVLTEGSPYDIPDTVTTVVIPEGGVGSPLSDGSRVEPEDETDVGVSPIAGDETREVRSEIEATRSMNDGDSRSSRDDPRRGSTENREVSARSADAEDASPRSSSDAFGELIGPETIAEDSLADADFVREIEEMRIPRKDLDSINEEASEELEEIGENPIGRVRMKSQGREKDERSSSTAIGDVEEEARGASETEIIVGIGEVSKVVESDLSPEGARPDDVESESSNEAKESSVVDEVATILGKCEDSMVDEEETSSVTRTAESSNEVKETTLTDGPSLTLDPTRPFVPELNLDSLQDITVSSFKITEDDCENPERGESENTNSITDNLTSDENNRVDKNVLTVEPSANECLAALSSSRSKSNEVEEATRDEAEERTEAVEETIVESRVEAKEDVCEKRNCYVTGPSRGEEKGERNVGMEKREAEERSVDPAGSDVAMAKEEEEEKELVFVIEDSNDHREVEILQAREEAGDAGGEGGSIEEKDDTETKNDSDDDNGVEATERKDEAIATREENPEAKNADTVNESENFEVIKIHETEKASFPVEGEEIAASEVLMENESVEIVKFAEERKVACKSEEEEMRRAEVTEGSVNVESEKAEKTTARSENENVVTMKDSREKKSANVEASIGRDERAYSGTKREESTGTKERRILDESIDTKDADIEKTEKESKSLEETGNEESPRLSKDESVELESARGDEKNEVSSERCLPDVQSSENDDDGKPEVAVDDLPKSEIFYEEASRNSGRGEKGDAMTSERAEDEFDEEISSRDVESDDVHESSYVEEETPLAFSRSASQCTTRRVSSGNLAKLEEDPSRDRHDENEREQYDEGASGNDPASSRIKFSGIDENETIEIADSNDVVENTFNGPRDASREINETRMTENGNKEYHIYVPEVDASADNSTTESSTALDSAMTKIQAGVRGFLVRRRLQRGQQNRSSTLNSIPSIQDSEAIEPQRPDDRDREAAERKDSRGEEARSSSPKVSMSENIASDPTKIRSNFRGYEARKRLRRENAVQRTTFSLDKSFAGSGLQHTGEFHDCIALPIHDIAICGRASVSGKNTVDDVEGTAGNSGVGNGDVEELASAKDARWSEVEEPTSSDETATKTSIPLDPDRLLFGKSSAPFLQFNAIPSVGQLVDLVVLAKNDAALETGYLNFITSVEDSEALVDPTIPLGTKKSHTEEPNSDESSMEPLALSDPPIGVIIEEITSSDAEYLAKPEEDQDLTMPSANSSSLAPEVIEDPSKPLSALTDHHRHCGNTLDASTIEEEESGLTGGENERLAEPETLPDSVTSDSEVRDSASTEKREENINPGMESMMGYVMLPGTDSTTREKHFLGPESSVDSMECPEVRAKEKSAFASSDSSVDASASTRDATGAVTRALSSADKDSEERTGNESTASKPDDAFPKLPPSAKIEDSLDLGSEDTVGDGKPVLEVTLKSGDTMKSTSLSQDSQLADERIESPVTMIQIAPDRSESLKRDDHSDNADGTGYVEGSPKPEKE